MSSQVETVEQFDLASFEVDSGYFKSQIAAFAEKYRSLYPNGWGQFYAAYLNKQTDQENLDYDEWAFLCEHFMSQLWTPPLSPSLPLHEKPEITSGFSILGELPSCLIPMPISLNCRSWPMVARSLQKSQPILH